MSFRPLSDKTLWWLQAGLLAYGIFFFVLPNLVQDNPPAQLAIQDLSVLPAGLAAGICAFLTASILQVRNLRVAWTLFGIAFLSSALAEALWARSELVWGVSPQSPAFVDLLYLMFYPLVFVGLLAYPSVKWDLRSRVKLLLDTLAIVVAATVYVWYLGILPVLAQPSTSALGTVVEVIYPVADVILVWALLHAYYFSPRYVSRSSLLLLLASGSCFVAADLLFASEAQLEPNGLGQLLANTWILGYTFAALAALAQYQAGTGSSWSRPPEDADLRLEALNSRHRRLQYLPYLALIVVFFLLVAGELNFIPEQREGAVVIGIALIMTIIFVRQLITIQDNQRLNQELLVLSRDLEERVSVRTAELSKRVEEVTLLSQQLQRANEDLRQIDRYKSEFIANMSHELRTPLTIILGYTSLLLELPAEGLTPFQEESLQTVEHNSRQLLALVDDLLDVSRMESGRFGVTLAPLAIHSLLAEHVYFAQLEAAQSGVALTANLAPDIPPVMADQSRLSQVLNNLLSNALKFTPPGGRVEVAAFGLQVENGARSNHVTPLQSQKFELPAGQWAVVYVKDDGPGIAGEDLPHLFTRFYRTAAAQRLAARGTGLGLYVAKTIVNSHAGYIGVESQLDVGSCFWFALPAIPPAALAEPTVSSAQPSTAALEPSP